MMLPALRALREWLERHPDATALAALEDIEAMCRDGERIHRFVSRRRILPSQRLRERVLVEQRLHEYRSCHAKVSRSSARRWITSVLGLPPSRVRCYLEEILAEEPGPSSVRDECLTLFEGASLTVPVAGVRVAQADTEEIR
jgi:hypothetical protein